MKQYIFPIITVALLMIFYLGIPDLDLQLNIRGKGKIGRIDCIIIAAITVIFAFVDFYKLGNKSDVETFQNISQYPAAITINEPSRINKIVIYTGVGNGDYSIEFSSDGTQWSGPTTFSQDAAAVLKWHTIIPVYSIDNTKYVRVSSAGSTYLGELFFLDEDDNVISYQSNIPELNDEQEKFQIDQTFYNSTYFDEIYHARTAWEHIHNVYPYEISHPPLGKLILSIGILIFGMNPFGWRFMGTLFGVLMLPAMYIFVKKIFNSTRVSTCSTLIFATDFMHFVQTRIATIDTYAVFFIIAMYLFMYIYISEDKLKYLGLSGIAFGIGCACKWTCIYAGVGLALIWLIYRLCKLNYGIRPLIKNILFCIVFFVFIPCIIYCLSYIPYATSSGIKPFTSKAFYQMILNNQEFMFSYHSKLIAEHPYSSRWYQWIFNLRPILYYLQYNDNGTRQSIGAFLNPMLCWGGLIGITLLFFYIFKNKDKTAAFIVTGYLSQLVPWIFITRLTFEYHYFPSSVFLVLAIAYVFYSMEKGTKKYKLFIYSFTSLSILLFFMFFPVLSGIPIKETVQKALLSWIPSWPF